MEKAAPDDIEREWENEGDHFPDDVLEEEIELTVDMENLMPIPNAKDVGVVAFLAIEPESLTAEERAYAEHLIVQSEQLRLMYEEFLQDPPSMSDEEEPETYEI